MICALWGSGGIPPQSPLNLPFEKADLRLGGLIFVFENFVYSVIVF